MSRVVSRHLWWVLGMLLVVTGLVLVLVNRAGVEDLGWFASTPLSEDPDWSMSWGGDEARSSGTAMVVSTWQVVGGAIVALGLLVVAAGAGYRLGRRQHG